jgi:hypothetical protein
MVILGVTKFRGIESYSKCNLSLFNIGGRKFKLGVRVDGSYLLIAN